MIVAGLNQMCYSNMKMCTNLPAFYRSLICKIKDENNNQFIFDYYDVDQIVEAAMGEKIPLITAKRWAISDKNKAQVYFGKSQDEQVEIASMTKICTAYTICRILDELELDGIEKAKNIYLRVSRKAAFMGGTSAYVQTDNRLSLYDCLCALLLPSGNDAAIVLATEFGRWLFMIGDKQKNSKVPIIGMKGKINNFSNK
jgi:D-alanyl-D-alanine carboxypeptidase